MVTTILYILIAIAILMLLITVHEFGHYLFGKLFGFKINEFAIGFGKAIYKKTKKNGEVFSIRLIPLGGFCAFEGEDEEKDAPGAFNKQKPWQRLIVLFGGVFFNFLFGVLMCVVYLCATGYAVPKLTYITPSNPNDFQVGDIIYKVNGTELESYKTLSSLTQNIEEGKNITLTISRNGEMKDIVVQRYNLKQWYFINDESKFPEMYLKDGTEKVTIEEFRAYLENTNEFSSTMFYKTAKTGNEEQVAWAEKDLIELGLVGKASAGVQFGILYSGHGENYTIWDGFAKCFDFAFYLCGLIWTALVGLFTGATALADVGGTITAVSQIAEISQMGFDKLLLIIPFLSFNLAIFNALPIPALDGARMVFVLIEWIAGKPVNRTVEGYIHTVGLFVLLGLVVFLDIYHFFFLFPILLL